MLLGSELYTSSEAYEELLKSAKREIAYFVVLAIAILFLFLAAFTATLLCNNIIVSAIMTILCFIFGLLETIAVEQIQSLKDLIQQMEEELKNENQ